MNDIMKIVQALQYSNILSKGMTKTIKNETREQKGGFLSMFLGTLGASLLGDLLKKKFIRKRNCKSRRRIFKGRRNLKKTLMSPHPLTNFEIQEYFKNEPRFNVFILEIIYLKQ